LKDQAVARLDKLAQG